MQQKKQKNDLDQLYIYIFKMDEDLLLKVLFSSLFRENFWIMVIVNLDYERFFRRFYNLILLEFPEYR